MPSSNEIFLTLRNHLHLTQKEMAQMIGLSRVNYLHKENDKTLDFAKALTFRQYINLKKGCSDSIYCTQFLNELEEKLGIR